MELARHFPGAERIGAPLKRLDRLLGNPRVQALLPKGACPILVIDAGFRVPWFHAVESLNVGWVSVLRVTHRALRSNTIRVCLRGA